MAKVNIYLTFDGECEEAFNFYKNVFNNEFLMMNRFSDMPPEEGQAFPPEQKDRVMHVTLPISDNTVIMGSDTGGDWSKDYVKGNNFSISINSESREEADRLFEKLSQGGHIIMPMADTFWDSYFGMLKDKFGIQWMVSYDNPNRQK